MTTTTLLVRRFLADYTRNGPNLVLLAVVPVVFVVVAAPPLADAARLLGGTGGGPALETVTAGWAAAFLTAVAMYFLISSARTTDRRLTLAGLSRVRLASARLTASAALALMATLVAVYCTINAVAGAVFAWRSVAAAAMLAVWRQRPHLPRPSCTSERGPGCGPREWVRPWLKEVSPSRGVGDGAGRGGGDQ